MYLSMRTPIGAILGMFGYGASAAPGACAHALREPAQRPAIATAKTKRLVRSFMPFLESSSHLVRMEDEVLVLHLDVAGVTAVGRSRVGRELGRRRVVVEERIAPTAGLRKSR